MINTMAVIGTGLVGTSVALAARRRNVTVYLSDRDDRAVRTAAALGAGVPGDPPEPVDLAVIAVPPGQIGAVLGAVQSRRLAVSYTDVASVKGEPEREVLRVAPEPARYVGGHPLAGGERSGPLAARGDLFQGRPWALTPTGWTSEEALRRATELVALCGAVPVVLSSRAHDDAVALTSHLPHLMASLTAARLPDGPAEARRLAGRGLHDVTRIAAGDSSLWGDILRANAPALVEVVRRVQADLAVLVPALDALAGAGGDRAEGLRVLVDLLDRGVAGVGQVVRAGPADQ